MSLRVRALAAGVALIAALCVTGAQANSIRFFGNGVNQVDRIKIRIDDPSTSTEPARPADVGLDFTIEFWVKGLAADNPGSIRCGTGVYGWIDGNAIFDRDRHTQQRAFGISVSGQGRIAFGATNTTGVATICGNDNVLDGSWHHVAVTRSQSGAMALYVDGVLDASTNAGPTGDLSYPDNGQPGNFCSGPCTASDPFIVLGAEKHDAVPGQLAYNGLMDELRISSVVRYPSNFVPPTSPFVADASTGALYHFDQASSGNCTSGTAIVDSATNPLSPGECFFGGSPGGPVWSSDSPFASSGPGSLQLSAANYAVSEEAPAGTVTISVTRTGGSDGAVTINYATAGGTAIEGSDYTATMGTLSWNGGESATKTFTIPITNDTLVDSGETFTVTLSAPSGGATLGSPSTATVTITDSDSAGTLQFTASAMTVVEGDGTAVLQVSRSGGTSGAASIRCTTSNGTAIAPGDYTAIPAPGLLLSWADGEGGNKPCPVTIGDDVIDEMGAPETFQVSLSQAMGAAAGSPTSATVSIQDDDPTTGALQFNVSGALRVLEGAGTAVVTVDRVAGSEGAVSAQYRTTPVGSTATAGVDYVETSGTLMWGDGDATSRQFSVTINADTMVESDETIRVELFNIVAAQPGNPTNTAITILNDDFSPAGALQLSSATYNVGEGAGPATITVRRVGGSSGAATVNYSTSNATAIAGADYSNSNGTLAWADGDSSDKTFVIPITDDTEFEGAETLNVQLANATGAVIGAIGSATVTINDNDVAQPGTLQLAQATLEVSEDAGTINIGVTRTGGTDGAVQVTVTATNGTAIGGSDYSFQNTSVSWAAGESGTRTVTIQVTNDSAEESAETFTVSLVNVSGGAALGTPNAMVVTISANDTSSGGGGGGGGGALDWWTLLLGLLPLLQRLRRPAL